MSTYPWAGYDGLGNFKRAEMPLFGTDKGWNYSPQIDYGKVLGAAREDVAVLGLGSARRSWEMHMEPDRFATLQALIGTFGTLTDWTRPTPDSRAVVLAQVEQVDPEVGQGGCDTSVSTPAHASRKIRVRVDWVSQ